MADNVVELDHYRNAGNGSREALIEVITLDDERDAAEIADVILCELWMRGFKLVPLETADAFIPPLHA